MRVTVGVNTHTDVHVAAALDSAGDCWRPGASWGHNPDGT